MEEWYGEDLAYIHDVGFGGYALGAAPGILEILARGGIREGLVVDLGCGSGLWAKELTDAGYNVLGIDVSEAMVGISRSRVPEAEFRVASLFEADISSCNAVTAIGEVLNYLFDPANDGDRALVRLFDRIHDALTPGGFFVFDVAEPGQVTRATPTSTFSEGGNWVVLVQKEEDRERETLTRRIVTFRKAGECYRRTDEVHRLRLYGAADIADKLRRAGFRVRVARGYGRYRLPKAHAAFVARKPA
jgi:SAM-dependent methyltransferase